jgi:hypothetical protein
MTKYRLLPLAFFPLAVTVTFGVLAMLPPALAAVLEADYEPQTACERLVAEANELGGKDNITVIVARFEAT